ncbi:hypothetical protein OGH69_04755 [Flavobacterium sp. MFBS3-15]|uniref:hypothetical protein n=1 Tax=Flavobacterium sp. MFBS3-15 TaxID=2989816 RepID=UPI0022354A97|nr:hypothetical protein [Flavobacterium sp. MFBS3-15]MCW4468268.1 hypothetical protein [Flavobacterium sp. MFBS3-15]
MTKRVLYCLLFCTALANAQEKQLRNNEERENDSAIQLFEKEYLKQEYDTFEGKITVIDHNTILFDNKTLLGNIPAEYLSIFTKGIFYPQLLLGNAENTPVKSDSEYKSLSEKEKFAYIISRNDTMKIYGFEELKFLQVSPKVKRFRFRYYRQGFTNPTIYFIELTNEEANEQTSPETFIKGARLTFLTDGWIMV